MEIKYSGQLKSENIINFKFKNINKFKNPLWICGKNLKHIIHYLCNDVHIYLYRPLDETLAGIKILFDDEITDLNLVENPYKGEKI